MECSHKLIYPANPIPLKNKISLNGFKLVLNDPEHFAGKAYFRIHAFIKYTTNSRISHYIAPSYGRPEQGHLAHCILGKSQQPEPEVRIARYAIAVFIYAFCESCQFSSIYSTLHPLNQHCIHSFISTQSMQIHNIRYHVLLTIC